MEKKKKFQIPTTCALLFMLMIVCAVLTWIIPAGAYETEKVGNLNKVIAGTYHVIDSTPVGPWGVLMAVMAGFYKSAKLIFMIMFCGGAVRYLKKVDPSTRPLDGWLPIRSSTPMSWLF